MKKSILVIVLMSMAFVTGCAEFTYAKNASDPIVIVLKAPDKTQSQLYVAAQSWFSGPRSHSNDGGEIINFDGKAYFIAQVITADMPCEGPINCFKMKNASLSYKLRIDAKDGEVKMTYTDFVKTDPPSTGTTIVNLHRSVHAITFQSDLDAVSYGTQLWSKELLAYALKK